MGKSDVQAKQLIEEMALHNYQYGNPRGKSRGMFEMEAIQMLTAKLDQISHKVDNMQVSQVASSSSMNCGACGMSGHQTSECLQCRREPAIEEVNAFNSRAEGNPYPGNFNSNWRQPARFPQSNLNYPSQSNQNQYRPSGFTSNQAIQHYQSSMPNAPSVPSRTEELLEQLLVSQQKKEVENEQKFQLIFDKFDQMQAHNKILESQIAQLSAGMSQRNYGKLPSQSEANPREGVNAVILRSSRQLVDKQSEKRIGTTSQPEPPNLEVSRGKSVDRPVEVEDEPRPNVYVPPPPYQPPLPFPQRIQKAKLEKQYGQFIANLQKLSINVSFLEALQQMPSYAKFLKELLSNKRNLGELETVALTNISTNGLQNKLPQKLQDPGSFSIPCHIGNFEVRKALCDLGASVSLIPLTICQKLDMGDPKPTNMTLQMADRSIKRPVGIIEDVPLKVGKFFIPVDFVVLDMEEDVQTPIILGRPFLATAGAMIDMKGGKLTFRIGDETAEFNVFPAFRFPISADSCFRVDVHDRFLELEHENKACEAPMEAYITGHDPNSALDKDVARCAKLLDMNRGNTFLD